MKKIFSLIAVTLFTVSAFGQQVLRSGYFLEGNMYRHMMNPAYGPDREGYVSFPFLGNLNMGVSANVGLSDFIHKTPDGNLTTFLNESVSADKFLNGINKNNRLGQDLNYGIFSMGFSAFGGYNTIGINLRQTLDVCMPYELFEFMKVGGKGADTRYQLGNLGISSNAFAEIALGHSHDINEQWRVGGKMKFLLGLYNANALIENMNVELTDEQWSISGNGYLDLGLKGLEVPTNEETKDPSEYTADQAKNINYDELDFSTPGLSGFGVAIDLGATYKIREDLELSASLLDLGFISWNSNTHGVLSAKPWVFDGFESIPYNEDDEFGNEKENSLNNQLDQLTDELEDLFAFQKEGETGSKATALGATLNLGALYTLPYYEGLKFGFLSSTRMQGKHSWSEGRFSANVAPTSWFDASVNYAVSSFGSSLGWMINFHPNKFNFFVGSDHQFFKINPQFIPIGNANMNIAMGINFNL